MIRAATPSAIEVDLAAEAEAHDRERAFRSRSATIAAEMEQARQPGDQLGLNLWQRS